MSTCTYTDGEYLEKNPTWHVEDSPWKAENIWRLISKHRLPVKTVAEVGCGAGEILAQLQRKLPDDCELSGYDISPQSHAMAMQRANERLEFHLADLAEERGVHFDLLLIADLIEHLDDYYGFLRKVKPLGDYTILHIPLDLSAYSVIRSHFLRDQRRKVGHIHFFSKDIALAGLEEAGFEVLDWFYPTPQRDRETRPFRQHVLRWLRKLSYPLNADLSVKMFGGRSLMVLAR
jgi:SAM-dependent methyltransferase